MNEIASDLHQKLILDGTKIGWHKERVEAWERGERIAPVTIDMALTITCQYACRFCYAQLQTNQTHPITKDVMQRFLDDCSEIGVKGISLVSDGESTLNPAYVFSIQYGKSKGIDMASGTNAHALDETKIRDIIPSLTYLRINITAGEPKRYQEIMGVRPGYFEKVCENIKTMMRVKKETGSKCTVGMQMVLMPEFEDQILPLAKLALELKPDYLIIKHCSDSEDGQLGVDYDGYEKMYDKLRQAEQMSTEETQISVKWSKIGDKGKRSYQRCYGPPFLIQLSGSGLVAPCGMLFNEQFKKFHIGNIVQQRFKDIVKGDRYWEVVNYLASPNFNAQSMCGSLCLQHKVNEALDQHKKGNPIVSKTGSVPHMNFV